MKVLFVGAHPDDIEFGAGGTIRRLSKRNKFLGLVLTSGDLRGDPIKRELAAKRASNILGYEVRFCRLLDGRFAEVDAETKILNELEEFRPDLVMCHSNNDRHRDHKIAHIATCSASRKIRNVLFFESPYSSEFKPKVYIELNSGDIAAKIEALKLHSEPLKYQPTYLQEDYVMALARANGLHINCPYAEAFEVGIMSVTIKGETNT